MPRREITGKVVSDKMQKTIVVAVESRIPHPRYAKIIKSTKRFKAHDEENTAHAGDLVKIVESKPLSKDKRWTLLEVLERAQ